MKRFFAIVLLTGFAVAVCHAVPYDSGSLSHKTELSKKQFELQPCELAAPVELPAAPVLVHDAVVKVVSIHKIEVTPQSNSPPII